MPSLSQNAWLGQKELESLGADILQQAPSEFVQGCQYLAEAAELALRMDPSFDRQAILADIRHKLGKPKDCLG